jgi:predicted Zn finger-like uncharacterized protein
MIVNCPNCNTRYKIDPAKIQGRGAKITCPSCKHTFVVRREGEAAAMGSAASSPAGAPPSVEAVSDVPSDIARRSFGEFGVVWTIRKGIGVKYEVTSLSQLRDYLDEGTVSTADVISYDARRWVPIRDIGNLEAYFFDVWRKAEAGELKQHVEEDVREDEADSPTALVGHGSALAEEIRRAIAEAKTPAPVPDRPPAASETPTPAAFRDADLLDAPDITGVIPVVKGKPQTPLNEKVSADKSQDKAAAKPSAKPGDPFSKVPAPTPAMGATVVVGVVIVVLAGGVLALAVLKSMGVL